MGRDLPDASVDVDVAVAEAAHREHHAVGVERRAGDGAGLCGREERGVGMDRVDARAVDVEDGEGVGVGAAGGRSSGLAEGGWRSRRAGLT